MRHRDDLECEVESLFYSFQLREGGLHMGVGQCCDMGGCIALFQNIDSDVQRIVTYAGGVKDTTYEKSRDTWIARDADGVSYA